MKIIDAHMHFSKTKTLVSCALYDSMVDYSVEGYLRESDACGIVASVCMGMAEVIPGASPDRISKTPLLADLQEPESTIPSKIFLCAGINPHQLDESCMAALEEEVRLKRIIGLKIYAGYYHFDVNDPIYIPALKFAEKHGLPVAIHSGDTYSEEALLEYSQPLSIDRLAVTWRNIQFIICHIGAPWIYDACEVAAKNRNVCLDISGLLLGNADHVLRAAHSKLWIERYQQALIMLDEYPKVLFGTDWPLVPMAEYVDFCKRFIPDEHLEDVFLNNAARVYGIDIRALA